MCGIAGIFALQPHAPPPAREALLRIAAAVRHRGPDETGLYRDARIGLAHTRLSVIGLSTGQQPMSTEDDALHVVFNGEIFNYLELREELVDHGCRFRTQSDTEVIVHGFRVWGHGVFERMNGQWAIALWDAASQRLTLCRDRHGIQPLHLLEHRGHLYFASEVKSIYAAATEVERAFDPRGLQHVFTFWGPVAPQGVFRGVSEIRPGHMRVYDGGQVRDIAYWEPTYPTDTDRGAFVGSLEDATEAVRASLQRATSLRLLRTEAPVGCYLSGGLDSSLVAALARSIKDDLQTFSLRFEDREYDETSFQRGVAARIGSEHREVLVSRRDIAEAFPAAVLHAERPILRTAPAPMMLLSRLARDSGIKVVLTGEGADEMFAGYDLFREGAVRRFWARQPDSDMRPRLLGKLYPYLARSPVAQQAMARQFFGRDLQRWRDPGFAHATRWRSTAALTRLLHADVRSEIDGVDVVADVLAELPEAHHGWSHLARDQYLEAQTLMTSYILSSQGDRMLMASSVEGRFPFLDREVVALANSLPPHYKLRGLDEKHVLKRLGRDLLPPEVLQRKKQPYRAPDAASFVGPDAPAWVSELLSESHVRAAEVFEPRAVANVYGKCRRNAERGQFSNADNMALVGILSTQLLYEHLLKPPMAVDTDFELDVDHDKLLETAA